MSHFDKAAKTWDDNPNRSKQTEKLINNIKEYLKSSDIVIDYGAGTGTVACAINDLVKEVIAIDNSTGMLEVLNEKILKHGIKNIKTLNTNLVTEPFNQKVNLIITTMTMHHIKDLNDLFTKFSNILEDNGHLIIVDLEKEDGTFHTDNTGVEHFGFEEEFLRERFKETGFKVLEYKTINKFEKNDKEYNVFLSITQKHS